MRIYSEKLNYSQKKVIKMMLREITKKIEKNNKQEQIIEKVFGEMDKKYPSWRNNIYRMAELAQKLSKRKQDNPTFEDVEKLYFKSLGVK